MLSKLCDGSGDNRLPLTLALRSSGFQLCPQIRLFARPHTFQSFLPLLTRFLRDKRDYRSGLIKGSNEVF